ncbi:DUF2977 domain-containing protein, partial [Staphylococcus aureus]
MQILVNKRNEIISYAI